ncbi:MAG: HAD family hydrolase [Candidatus Komeilibacteria bacterium]|nr:HAD family hydrolase [Candidatus Komeilibacteria bacterium]
MKTAIFDYSGVINDNHETTYYTVTKIFAHFGAPSISYEEFRKNWIQPFMLFYNRYLPKVTFEEEVEVYKKVYQEVLAEHPVTLYNGMDNFLKKLHDRGLNLMIVSSDAEDFLKQELRAFGLNPLFKEIICGVHDKTDSLQALVTNNKLDPRQTIFIGDTVHEVEAGKAARVLTGAVTWGIDTPDKLIAAKPDYLINNLDELEKIFSE